MQWTNDNTVEQIEIDDLDTPIGKAGASNSVAIISAIFLIGLAIM